MAALHGNDESFTWNVTHESYDADLSWILQKLTDRSGAAFGLMYRFVEDEGEATVLARCSKSLNLSEAACADIERIVRQRSADQDPSTDVMLQLKSIRVADDATPNLRILHMRFAPAAGVVVVAVVCRSEQTALLLHESIARRLYPVLTRYVQLWWLHRTARRRAMALQEALEISHLGILQLDRRGTVIYANSCARRLLDRAEGVHWNGDTVCTGDTDTQRLQSAVQHAILSNCVAPDENRRAFMLSLPRSGRRPLILMTVSVTQRAIDPSDAAAIVYLLDPEHDVGATIAPACRLYGLTEVERRLVSNLVSGASLAEAATRMHVALQTARTYLKHIFHKTSTNRQAELIRLILGSAASVGVDVTLV